MGGGDPVPEIDCESPEAERCEDMCGDYQGIGYGNSTRFGEIGGDHGSDTKQC